MRISVIAPGQMGAAIALLLHKHGAEVAITLAGRSKATAARAAGLPQLDSEAALAAWADVVLSIVPPAEALPLATRLAPALRARAGAVTYVDCNAVSPGTVHKIEAALAGVPFVDSGIIGAAPKPEEGSPRFYASGDLAASLNGLRDFGLDWRVVEGGIGAASGLKMAYAGITKGITALGTAMVLGATRSGAAAALHAELAFSQPEVLRYCTQAVPRMFDKAHRWVAEMEEISAFLDGLPGSGIHKGIAQLYTAMAKDFTDAPPDGFGAQLSDFYARDSKPKSK